MSISSVTSEALQLKLRELLPSQQGFSTDISASDTIIPIIDLTGAADGSSLPVDLARCIAFGSNTGYQIQNATTTLSTNPGFYRCVGTATNAQGTSGVKGSGFKMTDGSTTTTVWALKEQGNGTLCFVSYDLVFFLNTGVTLQGFSDLSESLLTGSIRQVADSNGKIILPTGFLPQ